MPDAPRSDFLIKYNRGDAVPCRAMSRDSSEESATQKRHVKSGLCMLKEDVKGSE
jgi:hypothetical protein